MPRDLRKYFRKRPPFLEETSILVGLPAVVGIVPWIPPSAYLELSEIVQAQIQRLETTRHNREDPLFADLKLSNRSLTETLIETKLTIEEFKKKKWRITTQNGKEIAFADVTAQVASRITHYMRAIAPIVEATPFGAPVVWGAFNMLLKMAIDDADMANRLADLIDSYMDTSEVYSTYWQLYRHSQAKSAQKVRDILGILEEDIRKFTEVARKYYFTKNTATRMLRTAVTPFAAEFQPIVDGIKDRTSCLKMAVDAARQEEEKRREVLNWISNVHYQDAHTNASAKRVPDTCNWLRKKEAYIRWAGSSGSAVLWVHGKAGFGKTILRSSVIDFLREILPRGDYRHKHVAYFYCNHGKPETLDTSIILASILKQIVSSVPEIPDKILGKFDYQKYLGQPSSRHSLSEIKELLFDSLNFVPLNAPVFIIIDGLDECALMERSTLLDVLLLLVEQRNPTESGGVKLAIFSRSYDDIRQSLFGCYEIPIQKTDNVNDMYIFLNSRIASSRSLQNVLQTQQGLRTQMIADLVNNSGGMFLWINLHQETISRERDAQSISQYLKHLPNSSDMEESYRRIVAQIVHESPGNRKLAETVLGWVLCAVRPLSVAELTDALSFLDRSRNSRDALRGDIIHSCHGLIDTEKHGDRENFRFVHFSACQFLQGLLNSPDTRGSLFDMRGGLGLNIYMPTPPTSPKLSPPLSPVMTGGLDIDTSEVQRQMADICMEYLCQRALKRTLLPADEGCKCRQEFNVLAAEQPFVLYASHAWVQHYRAVVEDDMELKKRLLQLFERRQNLELSFQLFWFQTFFERYPRGSTPLHIASYFGLSDMISTLLAEQLGQDDYCRTDNRQRTPVYWAAFHGDVDSLERFGISMTRGNRIDNCNLDLQQMMGEALLAAIEGDQSELVESLLAAGANPNSHVRDGKGVLFYATMKGDGNLPMVRRLIGAGASLEPPPPNLPPLEAAAITGSLTLATYYLNECSADVDVKSHQPFGLPLRSAVFSGHHEMVKLLLEAGADLVTTGESELIQMASMMGDHEVIDVLLQHSPSHAPHSDDCLISKRMDSGYSSGSEQTYTGLPPSPDSSHKQTTPNVSIQRKALRVGIRQGLRLAKMGNPSRDTLENYIARVQRVLQDKFTKLDFAFLEASEIEVPGLVQEFNGVESSPVFIENGCRCVARALIYMEKNSTTPALEQYTERSIKMVGSLIVNQIDNGSEGYYRTVRTNLENNLTDSIEKRQMERIEEMFAEVDIGMQLGATMVRHALWLRGCVKTFLTGIMEMAPDESLAKFAQFLEGVIAIGLSPQARGGPAWRRMVAFIELGYCAFAYSHNLLYPPIHLKIAELRKALKDGKIHGHETLLGHLAAISEGGRGDWEWDADESPWWHRV
ncbi:hypothetical protein L211DRAFT_871843 [Terfezia boudieri ATCC MYA-4762]|uniref:Uncharacterized protein n=1 Tax=Terfezia boudieri ATCC MYA-4762 TaxID=1051890 RepID=A0A3N4L9D1_9PEZI|nr:hypothetical protein L211DRAFT_871843 [Terfezia boudieri ATCC MYA-4762]